MRSDQPKSPAYKSSSEIPECSRKAANESAWPAPTIARRAVILADFVLGIADLIFEMMISADFSSSSM